MLRKAKMQKKVRSNNIKNNLEYDFIRGKRLTDKEYKIMLFKEQIQAEETLDKIMKKFEGKIQELNENLYTSTSKQTNKICH